MITNFTTKTYQVAKAAITLLGYAGLVLGAAITCSILFNDGRIVDAMISISR